MKIEQFVMAYEIEQDRIRALLPSGFSSLRPVLRINAEVRDNSTGYVEFNTAVERDGKRGWLNIGAWCDVPFTQSGGRTVFATDFLLISFKRVGIRGGCPAERDNCGCFFLDGGISLRQPEEIAVPKEFCDCTFRWHFTESDAHGQSEGKTVAVYPTEIVTVYPKDTLTPEHAARIPCMRVLGSYAVTFER